MRDRFIDVMTTDGEMVYPVPINVSNVAFIRPYFLSKTIKSKIVFVGGTELATTDSPEDLKRKLTKTPDMGQVIPMRRE